LPDVELPGLPAVSPVRKKVTLPALVAGGVQLKVHVGEPKLLASMSVPATVEPLPAENVPACVETLLAKREVRINEKMV